MDNRTILDDHSRTIIHIDVDYFYAQVEINKAPELKSKPVGVQQKNTLVTCNYVARDKGVNKCVFVSEAKELCPDLVLVNGEDLHDYREVSYKISNLLQDNFGPAERLGLDENFVDVSKLVGRRLDEKCEIAGHVFGDLSDMCDCGCEERLKVGTIIAQEIRNKIYNELNLTTCAGIAHNKLLAKLAGAKHKPNQQTVVFPNSGIELLLSLESVSKIPGIGHALSNNLEKIHITTVKNLQNSSNSQLSTIMSRDKAQIIHNLSYGIDNSPVKPTGRPQTIGIEDSCKELSVESEVKSKLKQLLQRLLILVAEDGRIPKSIKVTVRKLVKKGALNSSSRESRQCSINSSLFNCSDLTNLPANNLEKIMEIIMRLFCKMVNVKKPYHLTLLGLSFTKFLDKPHSKGTLSDFLTKKDLEVQSPINIQSKIEYPTSPSSESPDSSNYSSETDSEQMSKRIKINENMQKKRLLMDSSGYMSPSKLKVAELKLNSPKDGNQNYHNVKCPPNADEEVFWELPKDVQKELWNEYKRARIGDCSQPKKFKTGSILNFVVKS